MIVIFVREIAIQFQVAAIYPQVLFIYLQSSTLYAFEEINEWQHAVPPLVKNRRARLNNETHRPFTVWDDILIPGPVTDCDFCEWAEEMAIATGYIIMSTINLFWHLSSRTSVHYRILSLYHFTHLLLQRVCTGWYHELCDWGSCQLSLTNRLRLVAGLYGVMLLNADR